MSEIPHLKRTAREAWRIALPYFRSQERWIACGLLIATVGAQLALVAIAVAENYWRNAFFQTLQEKSWSGFVTQFWIYVAISAGFIVATVYQRYLTQWLTIRWRRWLTIRFLDRWLDGGVHYRAMIGPGTVDNPDQRVAEDIRRFIDVTLALIVGLLGAIARLISFVAVLWTLSRIVPLQLFGESWTIPGYLVWAALVYACAGTAVTHWIGRPLIPLDFEQERREADFRFALVRLRENAESIALLRGEASERGELLARFAAIVRNWYRLMSRQQWVGLFTGSYRRFSLYFPYFAMAPLYFGGTMPFGAFMQSGSAFNEVRSSFSYFMESYLMIAEFSAIVQRLSQFDQAIHAAEAQPSGPVVREVEPASDRLASHRFTVNAPTQAPIASLDDLRLGVGEAVLLTGVSGAGKTSLLRGIAGIWPYLSGELRMSALRPLALPQRAYIPLGPLRRILCYPQDVGAVGERELQEALAAVGLPGLGGCLDAREAWDRRLSEGEKQRLSLARALLFMPDLLLMDEATAALDEPAEIELHALVRSRLPETSVLAVSHRRALSAIYDRTIEIAPPR